MVIIGDTISAIVARFTASKAGIVVRCNHPKVLKSLLLAELSSKVHIVPGPGPDELLVLHAAEPVD